MVRGNVERIVSFFHTFVWDSVSPIGRVCGVFFGWIFCAISPNVAPHFTCLCESDIVYISLDVTYEEFIAEGWVGGFVCVIHGGVSRDDVVSAQFSICFIR